MSTSPAVNISHVLPDVGSLLGGTEVAVLGSNFPQRSRCFFGSEAARITWLGESSLMCVSPLGRKPGPVRIIISADTERSDIRHDAAGSTFTYQDDLYKELATVLTSIAQEPEPVESGHHVVTWHVPLPDSTSSGTRNVQTEASPSRASSMVDVQRLILDVVGLLRGAESDSSDSDSPDSDSLDSDAAAVAERLAIPSESGRTLWHLCAALDFRDLLSELMDHKIELDRCDTSGRTALHYATLYGHLECAKLLIDGGADVRIRDKWDCLAQELAIESRYHDIGEMLERVTKLQIMSSPISGTGASPSAQISSSERPEVQGGLPRFIPSPRVLPPLPQYLYYQVFDSSAPRISKQAFDQENPTFGRVLARDIAPPWTALIIKRYIAELEGIDEILLGDLCLNDGQGIGEPVQDDAQVPIILQHGHGHGPGSTPKAPLAITIREQPRVNTLVSTSSAPPPSSTSPSSPPVITHSVSGPRLSSSTPPRGISNMKIFLAYAEAYNMLVQYVDDEYHTHGKSIWVAKLYLDNSMVSTEQGNSKIMARENAATAYMKSIGAI